MNKNLSIVFLFGLVALLPACAGRKKATPVEAPAAVTTAISEEPAERTSGVIAENNIPAEDMK